MSLSPGTALGPYQVTAKIGEGGMGEVYRARDTKLDRDIALKVLPQAFTEDPDRLARFEREAKVLASINHPGIAGIYGLEESGDTRALVLELVEGPTLADRIAKGPIPLDEALPIAKQIAEALEAAHEAGVIHRDLKPANIKVRDDGTVKVLDFGLAKALDPTPEGDPSQSPTLTAAATQMGVIMGTAAYMSPEQARGAAADHRSDIWSFGVVFYEMLTGRRLFEGATVSDTLAAVIRDDPALDQLQGKVPAAIRRVLVRCLERQNKERLQHIGDARADIRDALATASKDRIEIRQPLDRRRLRRALALAVGALVLVGVGASIATRSLVRPAARTPIRFEITTPVNNAMQTGPVLSPDGSTLMFSVQGQSGWRVYSRSLGELEIHPVQGADGHYTNGGISPDGQFLLLNEQGTTIVKRLPLSGGSPAPIMDGQAPSLRGDMGTSWGPRNTIVMGGNGGLLELPALRDELVRLTTPRDDVSGHYVPRFLPDGRAVLFYIWTSDLETAEVAVYDFETGEDRVLVQGTSPQYATSGHLLFWRSNDLWAVSFDTDRLEVAGTPVPVIRGVGVNPLGFASYAVGSNGTLVYMPAPETEQVRSLYWLDRDGSAEPVGVEPRAYSSMQLSPDGQQLAVTIIEDSDQDVWIYDLARGAARRFTFDPAVDMFPKWTPDGQRIVFSSTRDGASLNLYSRRADGTGPVELLGVEGQQVASNFAADGTLVMAATRPGKSNDVGLLTATDDGYRIEWILETDASESHPYLSPDGRWLAYTSDESGRREVYVRPFPDVEEGRWQVSFNGGASPVWAPDSQELFYLTLDGVLMGVVNDTQPAFSPGQPTIVSDEIYTEGANPHLFDVSPDGERLLIIRGQAPTAYSRLVIVSEWFEELKRLVPTE